MTTPPSIIKRRRYHLANCLFRGDEYSTYTTDTGTRRVLDTICLVFDDHLFRIRQVSDYREVVKKINEQRVSGITATVTIEEHKPLSDKEADAYIDSLCILFSFATKNSVMWTFCEELDEQGNMFRSRGGIPLLFPMQKGGGLIPEALTSERNELSHFLQTTMPTFHNEKRRDAMVQVIRLLVHSEHEDIVDVKYVLAFMALERLQSKFLDKQNRPKALIHESLDKVLDSELGECLIDQLSETVEGLQGDQKVLMKNAIRNANRPSTAMYLEALCRQYGVEGFKNEMMRLRNRLFHSGTTGEFDFPQTLDLYFGLSHILDVCVLKALGYDGYYVHYANRWKPMLVP